MPHLGADRTPSEPRTSSSFPRGENRFWATALDTGSYAGYGSVTLGVSTRVNITAGRRYTCSTHRAASRSVYDSVAEAARIKTPALKPSA